MSYEINTGVTGGQVSGGTILGKMEGGTITTTQNKGTLRYLMAYVYNGI